MRPDADRSANSSTVTFTVSAALDSPAVSLPLPTPIQALVTRLRDSGDPDGAAVLASAYGLVEATKLLLQARDPDGASLGWLREALDACEREEAVTLAAIVEKLAFLHAVAREAGGVGGTRLKTWRIGSRVFVRVECPNETSAELVTELFEKIRSPHKESR